MLIHAIDIDHPPGIGIVADIALALEIVYAQATAVAIAAAVTRLADSLAQTDRFIDNFNEMHDAHRPPCGFEASGNLKQTSGIARHDYFGIGIEDVPHFPIAQLR